MMLEKIQEMLLNNGYVKKEIYMYENNEKIRFDFENVYINEQETEMYILINSYLSDERIISYHNQILCFQNWCNNDILIYNINLILIYENSGESRELRDLIYKFEKDGHLCRKIFIDSKSKLVDLELDILPFKPLGVVQFSSQVESLKKNIISLLGSVEMYNKLLIDKKNLDIDGIIQNL
jgi:hypothetical protein